VAPSPFETSATEVDGVSVISVRGELDLGTAPNLEPALEQSLSSETSVIIDLTECEFIDSTGIALIVRAWQQIDGAEDHGERQLVVCASNEQVQRVLEISGLNLSIPILGTREEGLQAVQNGTAGKLV